MKQLNGKIRKLFVCQNSELNEKRVQIPTFLQPSKTDFLPFLCSFILITSKKYCYLILLKLRWLCAVL